MEQMTYSPPYFIEELCFRVPAALQNRYLELEREIFLTPLSKLPDFRGAEAWVSADRPGEVTSLYFWKDEAAYHAIDQIWLQGAKDAMAEAMGEGNLQFVRAGHEEDKRLLVGAYR